MQVLVRYLCWGCGSEHDVYEDLGNIGTMEVVQWNLCPDCLEAHEKEKMV